MQQFTIPQFIDVEDKILGPITTRQFVIILISLMIMAISYKLFDFSLFLTVSIFVFIIMVAFAFVKINGRPFHFFCLNAIQTLKRPHIRVWDHTFGKEKIEKQGEIKVKVEQEIIIKQHSASRLAELSLMVDTGGTFEGDENEKPTIENRVKKDIL